MSNSKESGGELELIQVECTELEKVLKVLQARAKALKLNNGGEEIEIVEQMSVETVEGASNKELNEGASNVQPQVDSPAVKIFKDFIG